MIDLRVVVGIGAGIAAAAGVTLVAARSGAGAGTVDPSPAARRVVLVELFTSQGCSSCPPADRQLAELDARTAAGFEVVPLAFHVDYWNSIGWRDPFSAAEWTRRQHAYAAAFRAGRVYTPQAVVDGRADVVGSDADRLAVAIAGAAAREGASIALSVRRLAPRSVQVEAVASRPAALRGRRLDLMVAVYENDLVTAVGSGENARRTLRNSHVVRRLQRAASLPALEVGSGPDSRATLSVALDEAWQSGHLGVAAFLQDPDTLQVEGAAAVPIH